ncbi:MAG: thioredoxin family protein, partial [Pseudomonadota bacterium]
LMAGTVALIAAFAAPWVIPTPSHQVISEAEDAIAWVPLDRSAIARAVATGEVVFVDITADWCLTCKANKALVLDREDVSQELSSVVAMQGDWTRPDPAISTFLARHDRFGIPFNAVYGPAAPGGIVLPELLTPALVKDALAAAR